jgi:adenosylcobinamide kinase/adenosylcobinamide-phosphate guanylyltransferase
MKLAFVIGGARSGKSAFALKEAARVKDRKVYLATAEAIDEEMKERIRIHKDERGSEWDTYEEPTKVSEVIAGLADRYQVILIDCLTVWLSNVLLRSRVEETERASPEESIGELIDGLRNLTAIRGLHIIIVSNEVGMGIVPDNTLARRFRDLAGMLNQKIAEIADEVFLVTAGIPVKIKNNNQN